jgi:hypothetical protein
LALLNERTIRMHKNLPARKLLVHVMSVLVVASLTTSTLAADLSASTSSLGKPADTILVQKQVNNKKYKIKLYPNADHRVLFFSASGEAGRVYQLFIFNLEGQLVKQVTIRDKETTVLSNISKGTYLYDVFSEDEKLQNGQVIIR